MAQERIDDSCPDQHCGLCTFELDREGSMVGSNFDGSITKKLFKDLDYYCWWHCKHVNGRATAFHTGCYLYWGGGDRVKELGEVTRYDLTPTKGEILAEIRTTRSKIADCVWKCYCGRLPPEICLYVAEYLLRPYSAAVTLSTRPSQPPYQKVTTTKPIWAQFVKFHLKVYVAALSNTAYEPSSTEAWTLIYSPAKHMSTNIIYVAYDPWGITNVLFASSDAGVNVRRRADVWWQTMALLPGFHELEAEGDGLKLRNLACLDHLYSPVLWPLPKSPRQQFRIITVQGGCDFFKAMPVVINSANTTGYGVGLCGNTMAVYAQTPDYTGSLQMLRRDPVNWLYAPIHSGDWICQIWLRTFRESPWQAAFIFALRSGQVHVMGEHPRPGSEHLYKYKMLVSLSDSEPVTFHVDMSDGLRAVVIPKEWKNRLKGRRSLALPQPISAYPHLSPGPFFYSRAGLEGVSKIRLCRDAERIIGIMLCYSNNTWASLGRVALDQLENPKAIEAHGIWFLSAHTERGPDIASLAHIVSVALSPPIAEPERYLHVEWRGELEWWSSSRQCEVHYQGKQTLPTRL